MPASIAARMSFAKTLSESRKRVISLYRDWQQCAPTVIEEYNLDIPTTVVRRRIRDEFKKSMGITDLATINILIFKGRAEFDETVNQWKQREHIMAYLDNLEFVPKQLSFLNRFYEGK